MVKYIPALIVFIGQETAGLIIFPIMNRNLRLKGKKAWDAALILKGILERLVLFTALIHGYPQILIAFAAMKLGTRLHEEQNSEITNTYFLSGNLISIFLAMIGSIVVKSIWRA